MTLAGPQCPDVDLSASLSRRHPSGQQHRGETPCVISYLSEIHTMEPEVTERSPMCDSLDNRSKNTVIPHQSSHDHS
jgi:hypothetical protein